MNLTKYKQNEIVILSQQKKLREYEDAELNTKIVMLIANLLVLLGVSDGKEEHHTALIKFVRNTAKNFSFAEIDKAFELYISGELGLQVFQQLNAVVFGNVMKAYGDFKSKKIKMVKSLPQKTEKTNNEIKDIMDNAVISSYNEFKEKGDITGITHHIYDYLESKINLSIEKKQEYYSAAKKEVMRKETLKKSVAMSRIEHNEIVNRIDRIVKGNSNEVKNLAKHYALINFYKEIEDITTII